MPGSLQTVTVVLGTDQSFDVQVAPPDTAPDGWFSNKGGEIPRFGGMKAAPETFRVSKYLAYCEKVLLELPGAHASALFPYESLPADAKGFCKAAKKKKKADAKREKKAAILDNIQRPLDIVEGAVQAGSADLSNLVGDRFGQIKLIPEISKGQKLQAARSMCALLKSATDGQQVLDCAKVLMRELPVKEMNNVDAINVYGDLIKLVSRTCPEKFPEFFNDLLEQTHLRTQGAGRVWGGAGLAGAASSLYSGFAGAADPIFALFLCACSLAIGMWGVLAHQEGLPDHDAFKEVVTLAFEAGCAIESSQSHDKEDVVDRMLGASEKLMKRLRGWMHPRSDDAVNHFADAMQQARAGLQKGGRA